MDTTTPQRLLLVLVLAFAGVVAGCGTTSTATTPADASAADESSAPPTSEGEQNAPEDLSEPLKVSVDGEDLDARWAEVAATAATLGQLPDAASHIAGFEPFDDPRIALSDGRFLVRGRWVGDEPIAGWHQRNPDLLPEGEESTRIDSSDRPIRLFVHDPVTDDLTPVSHVPEVFAYSTAISVGESADTVLDVAVLEREQTVAYTTGFDGAGYDIRRGVYLARIPRS